MVEGGKQGRFVLSPSTPILDLVSRPVLSQQRHDLCKLAETMLARKQVAELTDLSALTSSPSRVLADRRGHLWPARHPPPSTRPSRKYDGRQAKASRLPFCCPHAWLYSSSPARRADRIASRGTNDQGRGNADTKPPGRLGGYRRPQLHHLPSNDR